MNEMLGITCYYILPFVVSCRSNNTQKIKGFLMGCLAMSNSGHTFFFPISMQPHTSATHGLNCFPSFEWPNDKKLERKSIQNAFKLTL